MKPTTGQQLGDFQTAEARRQAAEGCRIKDLSVLDQTDPTSLSPPPALSLNHGRERPGRCSTSAHSTLRHPTHPGSGSEDVWGDTMEVPLMYFL